MCNGDSTKAKLGEFMQNTRQYTGTCVAYMGTDQHDAGQAGIVVLVC